MRVPFRSLIAVVGLLVASACSGDSGGPSEEPMATVSFLSAPPAYIKTLAITVTGPGISTPMVFNLTIDSATHIASGTIAVPAGSNRHIVGNAFDSLGVNTHRGETTVTLFEGVNPPISFTMVSLTGSVSIQISFGSSVLMLTPGDTTVSVGDTISFVFAGTDESGAPVANPVWGVSNPAVASYEGSGKIVARTEGITAVTVNASFGAITRMITVGNVVSPAPPTGSIIVERDQGGFSAIYSVSPDGSNYVALPTGLGNSMHGTWGPGRSKIAFISGNDVWVMNADGTGRAQLTTTGCADYSPQISPDGSKVVWVWEGNGCTAGHREIYVMNIDGTGSFQLTSNPAEDNDPRWSADGSKIYFSSTRDGDEEIYVMNADGSNQTRLTFAAGPDFRVRPSPDGSKLMFTSTRDGQHEVYVMNSDGSGPLRYTSDAGDDLSGGWSPDGQYLLFSSDRAGIFDLFVMPVAGGNATNITSNGVWEQGIDWR